VRQHVAAAAQEREGAGADDEVDRAARAGSVLDVAGEVLQARVGEPPRGQRDRERVARDSRVDVDPPARRLQLAQLLEREQLLDATGSASARSITVSSSAGAG
jgi:hypothetical protein